MRNIIIGLQNFDAWKIQLTIVINFVSSRDADEERLIHSTSNKTKSMRYSDANEIINELFESLCSRYEVNLETSMGSGFIFDSVQLI